MRIEEVSDGRSDTLLSAIKLSSAWAAVGITSWADAASALAFLYTLILIGEWLWKKAGRPFCEENGWLKRKSRRKDDDEYQ
jgi:hypothetical protein